MIDFSFNLVLQYYIFRKVVNSIRTFKEYDVMMNMMITVKAEHLHCHH